VTYTREPVAAMRGCAATKPITLLEDTCVGADHVAPLSVERVRKMWRLRAVVNAS
jgi:hypothetical protein